MVHPSNHPSVQPPVRILLVEASPWLPAPRKTVASNHTPGITNKGTQATSSLAFYKSTKHTPTGWWNSHGPSRGKHLESALLQDPGFDRLARTCFPSPRSKLFPGKVSVVTHLDNWSTPSSPPFWKVDQQFDCFIVSFCHFVLLPFLDFSLLGLELFTSNPWSSYRWKNLEMIQMVVSIGLHRGVKTHKCTKGAGEIVKCLHERVKTCQLINSTKGSG